MRYSHAALLSRLGRYGEALAEIDVVASVEANVLGQRHPRTLKTRSGRASVLADLGCYGPALAEIDAFRQVQLELLGERHPDMLTTRYLDSRVLSDLGRFREALEAVDALAPVLADVLGDRHPHVFATRYRRARVLNALGRSGEALAEIDAFSAVQAEALGERHPDVLAVRALQISIESTALQNTDHSDELRGIVGELARTGGRPSSLQTLFVRYQLAVVLLQQGLNDPARAEANTLIADIDPATDPGHYLLRSARALLDKIGGLITNDVLAV